MRSSAPSMYNSYFFVRYKKNRKTNKHKKIKDFFYGEADQIIYQDSRILWIWDFDL